MTGARRRAAGAAADRARRPRRQVQPDLHRHLRAHRARRPGRARRARRAGGAAARRSSTRRRRPAGRPTRRPKAPARSNRPGSPGPVLGRRSRTSQTEGRRCAAPRCCPTCCSLRRRSSSASSSSTRSCWSRSRRSPATASPRSPTSRPWRALEVPRGASQHAAARRRGGADAARAGAGHGVDRHQAGAPARSAILYIFAIPLGISDLAAGLIWLAIFEQTGFLNTWLISLGLDRPAGHVPRLPEQARRSSSPWRSPRSGAPRRS